MLATIIQIDAWDPVANAAAILRASSHDHAGVCHLNDQTWWPAIMQLPKLRYDLFSGTFDGALETPSSNLTLALEAFPLLPRLALADARLQLWTGEVGASWESYTLRFDGIVTEQPRIDDDMLAQLTIAVDDRWLDTPLLALYEGTSGLEGEDGQKGLPKPLAIGAPRYVPGELIDSIDTVVQLSGYGPIGGVSVAMEKLSRFAASIGDHPTLAALKAATIPAGAWATCKANGLVRHGAPLEGQPSYILTGDVAGPDGWARKPGEIIRRLASMVEDAGAVSDSSLDALDSARPFNLSLYQAEQLTARELIQRVAASVNAVAGVSWLGELFAVPIAIGEPSLTLRSDGLALPVIGNVAQVATSAPFWRIALLAQRTWHKHGYADIAFTGRLTPRGRYKADETYREGDIVDMPDGSQWLFTGTVPASGFAPGTNDALWFNLSAALSTDDIRYDGGEGPTLQEYKPAEPGATRGAPEGTYVADKLAEEVIAEAAATLLLLQEERENMSKLLAGFLSAMQLAETREARAQALGFIDGEGIRTAHRREVTERVEGQTAIVTDLNLIGARSEDGSAYILNLGTVKVSPTETFGERLEEIGATFETQGGLITSNYSDLATAISNETAARTTAIETLNASIETLDGETAASIANVQDAIADEAGARATAITSVQASITGLTNSTNASVSSLNTAIANESSTRASALSSVNSTLGSHTSSITSLNSSVSSLNSTVASNYSALTATIGGLNTTVTTQSSAIATLQGRTGAFWSVVANTSSGATAFISARAETSGGSVTSNVAFGANEVHISNPSSGSGWTKVLSVSGGNVQIFGNLSATGSVSTPNLISNSVTKTVAALRGSNLTGSGGFVGIDAEAMITLAYAAEVIVLYTGFQNYTTTIPQYQSRLILYNASHSPIDSRVGPSGGAGSYETNFSFMAKFSLSAGTYYVEPQWLGGDSGIYLNAGSGVICLITYR